MDYEEVFLDKRLKNFSQYGNKEKGITFSYELESKDLKLVYFENCLWRFGDIKLLKVMCSVMHYVSAFLNCSDINASTEYIQNFSAHTVYEMVMHKKVRLSCWVYAQYLTECFLAMGIPARMVRCFSGIYGDKDCHCVTLAYCEEYKKFVLFDPANNIVLYSYKGVPLDIRELRDMLISGERILFLQKTNEERIKFLYYWKKNLIFFQCYERQKCGNELSRDVRNANRMVILRPKRIGLYAKFMLAGKAYPSVCTMNQDEFWKLPQMHK